MKTKINKVRSYGLSSLQRLERLAESVDVENQPEIPEMNREEFIQELKNFYRLGESVYRTKTLKEISKKVGRIVENATSMNLKETEGWFDQVTVSRHNKQLKESYKVFEKCVNEINTLQQRLESSYEDIGEVLKKYYDV